MEPLCRKREGSSIFKFTFEVPRDLFELKVQF